MVSLVDAAQAMTRASLDPSGMYAPVENYPRDPLDTSPFGPLWPLHVQAINPPRQDTGQPEPRVWEYPTGFNLPGTGDRLLPWEVLRAASTNVDVIRRCIEIRKDDVRTLEGSWNVSEKAIKAAQEADPTKPRDEIEGALRKQYADDIERLGTFWERPWITNGVRFGQWVAAVMEDHITLDAVAIYPVTTVGGDVIAFRVVDGSTIKLLINLDGERPQPPFAAFQQILEGFPRGEYLSDVVLTEDGTEDTSSSFTARQITYWRENFRTYTPYGFSQVEQALVSAALYLKRQGWMHSEYDEGSTPLTWLVPEGDKFVASQQSPAQRREYETAINDDLEGQIGKRHRIKVSYPGFKPEQMSSVDERYKPEYDRFLVNMLIGHMGVTMDRFGLTETKGLGATGQHERQAEVQDDSGVNPDVKMIQDLVLELSRNYLDAPLELVFTLTKPKTEDEAAKSLILDQQRKRGTITQNEDRKASGLQPLALPEADMPSMVTATGVVYLEGGAQKQAEMDAAAVELAKNPPVPGSTPGAPGRGPAGGSGGAGGSRPKPTGPKSAGPTNKAAGNVAAELRAYARWHKALDGKPPARPFRFEVAEPHDFGALAILPITHNALDPVYQAFEGYEWRQDITKDWRAWNAAHPLHPRGPHGRFVKVGNLVDELRRTNGPLSDLHEEALDEAARRTSAARHIRRGESQLADDLERYGLLEEYGGPGGNKNKLELSEAGRRHLQQRGEGGDAVPTEPSAPGPTPEPEAPTAPEPESQLVRGRRIHAVAEAAGEVEELVNNGGDPDTIRRRVNATAKRNAADADLADLAAAIAVAEDTDEMRQAAREFAESHGLTRVGDAGANVAFDPGVHAVIPGARRPERGEMVGVVRPGFTTLDDSPIARAVYGQGQAVPVRRADVAEPYPDDLGEASMSLDELADNLYANWHAQSGTGTPSTRVRIREHAARVERDVREKFGEDPAEWPFEARRSVAEVRVESRLADLADRLDEEERLDDERRNAAPDAPEPTPAQRREASRAERLAARDQRRAIAPTPVVTSDPTSRGQSTDNPGIVAGMTTPQLKTGRPEDKGVHEIRLPDGTIAKRKSQHGYTHAVLVTVDRRKLADYQAVRADQIRRAVAAYEAGDMSQFDRVPIAYQGGKPAGYGLRFKEGRQSYTVRGAGRTYEHEYGIDFPELGDKYAAHTVAERARIAAKLEAEVAELRTGPEFSHRIGRWSGSREAAEAGISDKAVMSQGIPGVTGSVVEVGSDLSAPKSLRQQYDDLGAKLSALNDRMENPSTRADMQSLSDEHQRLSLELEAVERRMSQGSAAPSTSMPQGTGAGGGTSVAELGAGSDAKAEAGTGSPQQGAPAPGLTRADRYEIADEVRNILRDATTREGAARQIDAMGLTAPQLRQLAGDIGVPIRSGTKKADVRDTIVSLTAGRRLDSLAINPGPAKVPSADERQVEIQTKTYNDLLARAEDLDTQINFAESEAERRQLERDRDRVGEQMAAVDRQITAARKRIKRGR